MCGSDEHFANKCRVLKKKNKMCQCPTSYFAPHRKIKCFLNKVLDSNGYDTITEISNDMNLKNDIGFDSFMLAELTVEIEEVYNVDIFKDTLVFTIGDIKNKLNG